MNQQQQQQQQDLQHQRTNVPNEASSHAKHPSSLSSSTTQLTSFPAAAATTNNGHANDLKASVLSAGVTDVSTADISSSSAVAQPSPNYGGCGSACWMILGPVIAGVVVAAMVFGLVMTKRRRRLRAQTELDLKTAKANDVLDDDDLMVEMFEPPELLSSGNISGAFFNWRNASSPPDGSGGKESRRGSAQFSGRSTALGLTTILEEGSGSYEQQQRIKKYHGNIRRPSGKGSDAGMLSPLKLTSPNPVLRGPLAGVGGMRAMSLADTPPLSPLISPTASPAPSDAGGGGLAHAAPGQQLYLTAPVGGRPKRKLTIPYNPQDVTRRRSLEGAW